MVGHSPPPFFKRGPAPLAKLVFFVIVSLALLISDLNLRYLDAFRQGLSVLAYPLQMAAATPADFVRNASNYFSSLVRLQIENKELKSRQLQGAERLLRLDQLEQENRHLRALLEARERQPVKSVVAEIMYTAQTVSGNSYITLAPYVLAALVYFCINYPASKAIEAIERRMRRGDKQ